MTERKLFPDDNSDKQRQLTPHNGTPASRIAAKLARPFASRQMEAVFDSIESAGAYGATDEEMQIALNMTGNSQRPRRCKLVEQGRVKDSGNLRLTSSGRPATVWVRVPPDQVPVAKSKADWPTDSRTNPNRSGVESVVDFQI